MRSSNKRCIESWFYSAVMEICNQPLLVLGKSRNPHYVEEDDGRDFNTVKKNVKYSLHVTVMCLTPSTYMVHTCYHVIIRPLWQCNKWKKL